jgi:hypothetical protein
MSGLPECAECARLWSAYSKATRDHIELEGKLRMAEISHDAEAVQKLSPMVCSAAQERTNCRKAIARHEQQVHGLSIGATV